MKSSEVFRGGDVLNFAEMIQAIRIHAGLSRKEFANKIGASQAAVTYWESGQRQPRLDQLEKIAEAFDINMWDMCAFYESDKSKKVISKQQRTQHRNKEEQDFIERYELLNELGRRQAANLLDMLTKVPEYCK